MTMFPDLEPDDVHRRVDAKWDFTGPLPVPKPGWMRCGFCGSDVIQARHWKRHERRGGTVRYRCDLSVKCCDCSAVWIHGIAVPDEWWHRYKHLFPGARILWRDGLDLLRKHGADL